MAVALIWAGAVVIIAVVLGVFGTMRFEAFMRDKHKLPASSVITAERMAELARREATYAEEIALKKVQLARQTADEQTLLDRAEELSSYRLGLERARLQALAVAERQQAMNAGGRERAEHLVQAYTAYLNGARYRINDMLSFPQFVAALRES